MAPSGFEHGGAMSGTSGARKATKLIGAMALAVAESVAWAQGTARRMPAAGTTTGGLSPGGRKVALVIGNKAYPKRPLVNPANDATDLETLLRQELGFQTRLVLDATKRQMKGAVEEFVSGLRPGDVGLFYPSLTSSL